MGMWRDLVGAVKCTSDVYVHTMYTCTHSFRGNYRCRFLSARWGAGLVEGLDAPLPIRRFALRVSSYPLFRRLPALLLCGVFRSVVVLLPKFGDVHPGRSCRLRKPGDEYVKSVARTGGNRKAKGGGGSAEDGGGDGEGWSMFDWGDGGGGGDEDYGYDDPDEEGRWATSGRFWRDEDDDKSRMDL